MIIVKKSLRMYSIKVSVLSLIIAIAVFFSACKKDPAVTAVTTAKVRSETTTSPTGSALTFRYTYDSAGRQLTATTDTVVTSYLYAAGSVTRTITLAGHYFVTNYVTNAAGYVASDSRNYVYSYDANGYRTGMSYTGNGNYDSTTYTIANGNVQTEVQHQADSATDNRVTTTYTYYSNIDNRDYGMNVLSGMPNNNLIKTETIVQVINGSTYTSAYSYTYSYNAQGMVTQQVKSSGTATYTTNYTY